MKRTVAVLLAVLLVLPAGAFMSVSAAESDWNSFWVTHFNELGTEGSGVIITSEANNTVTQAWRYVIAFSPVSGGLYEITDFANYLSTGGDPARIAVPDGGFIWALNYGNDYSSIGDSTDGDIDYTSTNCNNAVETAITWTKGMVFEFRNLNLESLAAPTTTTSLKWYEDGYICTAQYRMIDGADDSAAVESISVDGKHNDSGWLPDEWITVNGTTGTWQKSFSDTTINCKYQLRTDDSYVYGAAVINTTPVAGSGNGSATNLRIWFNTSNAAKYTANYDIYWNGTTAGINTSLASTSAKAAGTVTSNSFLLEFAVPLSEIGASSLGQIPYYISISTDTGTEEPCLYYPKMSAYTSPAASWLKNCDGDLNVYARCLNNFEFSLEGDGTYYALKGIGTYGSSAVEIPSEYNGLPVRTISKEAFAKTDIISVTIPDSVVKIGQAAFGQCTSLQTVDLGEGINEIGFGAFMGCSALESVEFPASLEKINNLAFSSCQSLKTVNIPITVTNIGSNAFSHCADLTDIYCEASRRPVTWSESWAGNCDASVHWGDTDPSDGDTTVKLFWVTHFNDTVAEGAGSVFTQTYSGGEWNLHIAFTPVEGTNAYRITAVNNGMSDGSAAPLAIPNGGFVYTINKGNDYPELELLYPGSYTGLPDYTSPSCNSALEDALTWFVGDVFVFSGLDISGATVPTSTPALKWYEDAYVCTATYSAYVDSSDGSADDPSDGSSVPDGSSTPDGSSKDESSKDESSKGDETSKDDGSDGSADEEYAVGDVNADGRIDQFDYVLVKRGYFNTYTLSADEEKRADVNYDNVIDQFDYILLRRIYFGTYTIIQN